MPVQTTYNTTLDKGVAGQIANMIPATIISRIVEETAGIGFGKPVAQGTSDNEVTAWTSGDTKVVGITARERSLDANSPDEYADKANAAVLTQGAIWVQASVAVNAGDPVHVLNSGAFGKTGGAAITGARWDTSTTGAGLALVRIG